MTSTSSFGKHTSGQEVARTYSAQCANKTVLITGVSIGGIGEAIARAFACGGASPVIITGRNDERIDAVVKALSVDYPNTKFRTLKLDLASIKASLAAAKEILDDASIDKIDIIIGNAGGGYMTDERQLTTDGIEMNFAINHIGHFVFIKALFPKLLAAARSHNTPPGSTRVVMVSSLASMFSPIRFSDWNFDLKELPEDEKPNYPALKKILGMEPKEGFHDAIAYGQAKTANVLFATHLNTLLSGDGIRAFAIHPGGVTSTGQKSILEHLPTEQREQFSSVFDKNIDEGSSTVMVAALDPNLSPESGIFLNDCQIFAAPEWATSKDKAEKLWKLSEEIVDGKLKG